MENQQKKELKIPSEWKLAVTDMTVTCGSSIVRRAEYRKEHFGNAFVELRWRWVDARLVRDRDGDHIDVRSTCRLGWLPAEAVADWDGNPDAWDWNFDDLVRYMSNRIFTHDRPSGFARRLFLDHSKILVIASKHMAHLRIP